MSAASLERAALLDAYRRDRRALEIPNYRREDLGCLVRYTPLRPNAEGVIAGTHVSRIAIDAEIRRQVAYFRDLDMGFEWKVFGADEPPDLQARLASFGFAGRRR